MRGALAALAVCAMAPGAHASAQVVAHEAPLEAPDDRLLTLVCDARGATALTSQHALRWDGRAWRAWETPEGGSWRPRSAAVLGDGTLYVAVGGLVHRLSRRGWTSFSVESDAPTGPRHGPYRRAGPQLVALTAAGPERVVGVGSNRIYLRDGDVFRPFWAGTWRALGAIWGQSTTELWAVGGGDAVQRWDGARWRSMHTRSGADWVGVTGSGARDVWLWAGGSDEGTRLMRFDGRRFADLGEGLPPGEVEDVATDGRETFVSLGGAVLRRDGERWLPHVTEAPGARICASGETWIAIASDTRMWTWPRRAPPAELAPPGRSEEQ